MVYLIFISKRALRLALQLVFVEDASQAMRAGVAQSATSIAERQCDFPPGKSTRVRNKDKL